ncbi:beta-ketoacyl-ACP synthase 3 [Kitasatospora sp. McL0602]|uniref:beta-ketoacyl-ACP synthase 3 n=1 Tax=Kitasatospora sp. McL0602 TaxID=3439530 RepID=UPI003F8BBC92
MTPHSADPSTPGPATAVIRGIGAALPPKVVTNQDVIALGGLTTTDDWIVSRTGISRRRRAAAEVDPSDLAVAACTAALAAAPHVRPDLLLLATTTPDRRCPATAPEVAHRLGLGTVPAFDLSAVCSGFLYALITATALLRVGSCAAPLVVAAEKYSAIIDPYDRDTAALFGDGAGAVLLTPGSTAEPGAILRTDWGSDGDGADLIAVAAGGARAPNLDESSPPRSERFFRMRGREVYLEAVVRMTESSRAVLAATGWPGSEVEAFIGHQANQRILDAVADRLDVPVRSRIGNIREVGNTAGASIPIALADAVAQASVRPGARTLLTAFGGGLTWASVTLNWPEAAARTALPGPRRTPDRTRDRAPDRADDRTS